jgi:hypothetical protein
MVWHVVDSNEEVEHRKYLKAFSFMLAVVVDRSGPWVINLFGIPEFLLCRGFPLYKER